MRKLVMFLALALVVAACNFSSLSWLVEQPSDTTASISGDVQRGSDIFSHGINDAPPCVTCHARTQGMFSIGPTMQGISQRAGDRVEGLSIDDYLHQSILEPSAFIVPGFRSIMYPDYADHFSAQDVADLIAYLKTL